MSSVGVTPFQRKHFAGKPIFLRRTLGGRISVVIVVQRRHVAGKDTFLRRVLGGSTSVVTLAQRRHAAGKPTFLRRVLGGSTSEVTRAQRRLRSKITFETGSVRRAAQIYCAGTFGMTFHSDWSSLTGTESRATQLANPRRKHAMGKPVY